jgi:hypothetical protein
MFVIKAKLQEKDKKDTEWYLQGYDKRPLRFESYGFAEREAYLMLQGYVDIEGLTFTVEEEG